MEQIHKPGVRPRDTLANLEGPAYLATLLVLTICSVAAIAGQASNPIPLRFAGMVVDRLSGSLSLLVAAVGAATYRFSMRYLDGEPRRAVFLRWLAFTVGSAYVLMLSTNLVLLFASWMMTSLGLHNLLTFYPDRPEALRPARKKFLISRLGDLALIAAIAVIAVSWSTLDIQVFLQDVRGRENSTAASAVSLLIVLAALTKSAQFPFHSWLPETMESPTPVSALMHAGIINAGGALLLRFSPLIIRDPAALGLLVTIGTLTTVLAMPAMWAQVKVKRTLAWSTVSQMGFMMVQFGLGVFPAAALHIVGHGCYKAWSFLRSGELPASSSAAPIPPARSLVLLIIGTLAGVPAMAAAAWVTGFSPWHGPGELALAAIVAMSIGQLWVVLIGGSATAGRVGVAVGATLVASVGLFALYRGSQIFLAPVIGDLPAPSGPLAWVAAAIPVTAFATLAVVHALLPVLGQSAGGRAFRVHALHGFYLGAIADRLVGQIWGRFETKGVQGA